MWVLVTYDVSTDDAAGRRRLRHVAKVCESYGQRVQKSVFECTVTEMVYEKLKGRLLHIVDLKEDSIRFYKIPEERERRVEEFGVGHVIDFKGPLVV